MGDLHHFTCYVLHRADMPPAVAALETDRALKDLYRHAARRLDESESWVRTFGRLVWEDNTRHYVAHRAYLGSLSVDRGGLDI